MVKDFYKRFAGITEKDTRYKPDAYEFVLQALWFTQAKLKRTGHVTARELLEGIREYGLEQYGPMAKTVFKHWGIKTTQDFGEIVFSMVKNNLLHKTEEDSLDDFRDVYNFEIAFDAFDIKKR